MNQEIFQQIDNIIERVDKHKIEPIFSREIKSRNDRK